MARTETNRPRDRHRVAPGVARFLSFLGCAITLQATPAAAETRRPVPPSRDARHAAPPWSEATETSLGSVARARATSSGGIPIDHPAVHPERGSRSLAPRPLFPRIDDVREERRRKADAMARHPAGKGTPRGGEWRSNEPATRSAADSGTADASHAQIPPSPTPRGQSEEGTDAARHRGAAASARSMYRVRIGDSLWRIAARAAGTSDAAAVAARVDRIYRLNRKIVGPDPDLIFPGQVLRLSGRDER